MSQDDREYDESENAFIECISALAKSFEAKAPSSELQVTLTNASKLQIVLGFILEARRETQCFPRNRK